MSNSLKATLNYRCARKRIIKGPGRPGYEPRVDDLKSKIYYPVLKKEKTEELFDTACELLNIARKEIKASYAKKWFGNDIKKNIVTNKTETIYNNVKGKKINIRFTAKCDYLGAYDSRYDKGKWIGLGLPMLFKRYSDSEKVMTILHEMSHIFLQTHDLGAARGPTIKVHPDVQSLGGCYGPYAYKLAHTKIDTLCEYKWSDAINNAENWGYYLAWYGFSKGIWDKNDDLTKAKSGNISKFMAGRINKPNFYNILP